MRCSSTCDDDRREHRETDSGRPRPNVSMAAKAELGRAAMRRVHDHPLEEGTDCRVVTIEPLRALHRPREKSEVARRRRTSLGEEHPGIVSRHVDDRVRRPSEPHGARACQSRLRNDARHGRRLRCASQPSERAGGHARRGAFGAPERPSVVDRTAERRRPTAAGRAVAPHSRRADGAHRSRACARS